VPKFFFNVRYDGDRQDTEGEELPDADAAWREATIVAGEVFKDIDGRFRPGQELRLQVTDEQRKPLYVIRVTAEKF
jgi:hypothetical protein